MPPSQKILATQFLMLKNLSKAWPGLLMTSLNLKKKADCIVIFANAPLILIILYYIKMIAPNGMLHTSIGWMGNVASTHLIKFTHK